jgi:hypothetical protein
MVQPNHTTNIVLIQAMSINKHKHENLGRARFKHDSIHHEQTSSKQQHSIMMDKVIGLNNSSKVLA